MHTTTLSELALYLHPTLMRVYMIGFEPTVVEDEDPNAPGGYWDTLADAAAFYNN